jgi:hypothetical protein
VIGSLRAYVDESLRVSARLYLMAAVLIHDDRAEEYRAVLRGLLGTGLSVDRFNID